MISVKALSHFDENLPIIVATDASLNGIGGVLMHKMEDGSERPVAYVSRTLNKAERNYSVTDREALAIVFAVQKFHDYIDRRKFKILTDHQALQRIFGAEGSTSQTISSRLIRWNGILQAYNYDIKYLDKHNNLIADTLSRLPLSCEETMEYPEPRIRLISSNFPITKNILKKESEIDYTLCKIRKFINLGWPSKNILNETERIFFEIKNTLSIEEDIFLSNDRVIIPENLRKHILDYLHTNHAGVNTLK